MACRALSSISFVCDALIQKRTRDSVRLVAGKPTITTAMPLLSISWLNALRKVKKMKKKLILFFLIVFENLPGFSWQIPYIGKKEMNYYS